MDTPFHKLFTICFTQHTYASQLTSDVSLIDVYHSDPELPNIASTCFNKWFGITFIDINDINGINHVRESTTLGILRMYHIPDLYDHCTCILSEQILHLALIHTPPLTISCYIADLKINDVLFVLFLPNPTFVLIHNCIISRLILTDAIWSSAYSDDKEVSTLSNLRAKVSLDE